jgi:3-ketosteroid 9alpha-monooxygenase subunit A
MGTIMMWHDPDGLPPSFDHPYLKEWDEPGWVRWDLDHLGVLNIHGQEILDNMADVAHLGPTHGSPCEWFENEFRDHIYIQRQGGFHQTYNAALTTVTWYTGPGILLSKQQFGNVLTFELIANTPVDNGVTKVWHACLSRAAGDTVTEEDRKNAKQIQAGALEAFATDFAVWGSKRPALKIRQLPTDGPFAKGRKWYGQFFSEAKDVDRIRAELNGLYHTRNLPKPDGKSAELEKGLFS